MVSLSSHFQFESSLCETRLCIGNLPQLILFSLEMLTFDIKLTKRNAYVHVPMAKSNALQAVEDNFIILSFLIIENPNKSPSGSEGIPKG